MRDLNLIVYGLVEAVGGGIVSGMFKALQAVLWIMGLISDKANQVAEGLGAISDWGTLLADDGRTRILRGVTFSNLRKQPSSNFRIGTGATNRQGNNDFLSRLRRVPRTGGAGGGRGGGVDRSANRLADSVRQLTDAQLDLALTKFEARVDRVKFLMDNAKKALDRQLKDHLISITDYYNKLLDVEKTTIEAEIAQQQAQRERDIKRTDAKIKELTEKQRNAKTANDKAAFGNEIEAERVKLAAKLVEHNEKIAELTGKIKAAEFESAQAQKEKLNALRDQSYEINRQLLDVQNRTADSEILGIAGQFSDQLLDSLSNFDAELGEPIKKVIEDINVLGRVTSTQLRSILAEQGVSLESLSVTTRNLITLMERLEDNAKFKGFQQGIAEVQDNLDQSITEILQKYRDLPNKQNDANREIAAAITAAHREIEGLLDKAEKLAQKTGDTGFLLYIRKVKSELTDAKRQTNEFAQSVNGIVRTSISTFVDSVIDGNDSIIKSFLKLFSSILINVAKVIIQTVILNKLFAALGLTADKGFGGFLGGIFKVPGTPVKKAEGGFMDGSPAPSRHQAAAKSLINGSFAPSLRPLRLASGGFVGALEDKAQRGGTGVANSQLSVGSLIEKFERNGERTILNVIGRNRTEKFVPA